MNETGKVTQRNQVLSSLQRLELIDTLNRLPVSELWSIEFALEIPPENLPGINAASAERSAAILRYLESSVGPGLGPLLTILDRRGINTFSENVSSYILTPVTIDGEASTSRLMLKLEGEFDEVARETIQEILAKIQKLTDTYSVQIKRVHQGSIEIELIGPLEALTRCKGLIVSGKLVEISGFPVVQTSDVERGLQRAGKQLAFANLSGAILSRVILSDADLSDADLSRAILMGADLSGADLNGADFMGAYLSGANLSRAVLRDADLHGADLSSTNFSGTDLSGADLSSTNFSGTNLSGANLSGANLSNAYLSSASLRDADLSDADLSRAVLRDADLRGANLRDADLSRAVLRDADLHGADLHGAGVEEAIFADNPGLIHANKDDLQRRGAIFQDTPGSNVPSLARR